MDLLGFWISPELGLIIFWITAILFIAGMGYLASMGADEWNKMK